MHSIWMVVGAQVGHKLLRDQGRPASPPLRPPGPEERGPVLPGLEENARSVHQVKMRVGVDCRWRITLHLDEIAQCARKFDQRTIVFSANLENSSEVDREDIQPTKSPSRFLHWPCKRCFN